METDTPARITLAQAREAIRLLPGHLAAGYEWDCDGCLELMRPQHTGEAWPTPEERRLISARCPHSREGDAPISRLDVLAILDRVGA